MNINTGTKLGRHTMMFLYADTDAGNTLDFLQVLLSKVLYEDCMTFLPECGADKSSDSHIPTHLWIHNDFMYVRFGGIRSTKTWSKSSNTHEHNGLITFPDVFCGCEFSLYLAE